MVDILPVPPVSPVVVGLINFHGTPVPVFDLLRRAQHDPASYGAAAFLLIGRTARRPFAMAASAVDGVMRVPGTRISAMKELLPGAGMLPSVLPGERGIVFVHDPETFLTSDEEHHLDSALLAAAP